MENSKKKKRKKIKIITTGLFLLAMVAVIEIGYYNKSIGVKVNAATDGCPPTTASAEWVPVADFCIMKDVLNGADEDWRESAYSCLDEEDARLCTSSEWMQACNLNQGNIISLDDMETDGTDDYEWVGDIENANGRKAVLIGENGCGDIDSDEIINLDHERRCCVNRERY